MTTFAWLSLVACAGQLALAILSGTRIARSPLAWPLALVCLVFFGWNFAALGHDLSGDPRWRYVDVSTSPFTMPASLHFILTFAGERRRLGRVLAGAYAAFGALSVASAASFVSDWGRAFAGSDTWALVHLALVVPGSVIGVWVLRRHLRESLSTVEQTRTYLVITALVVGATFASTELVGDLGVPVPRLGNVGTLTSTCLLAVVAFRFGLFERNLSWAAGVYALAGGAVAVLGYMLVFQAFAANTAMLLIGSLTLTIILFGATRQVVTTVNLQRARRERLASMGRLSAQMAHDLKNPLAALKGAIQFLEEERRQGRSIDAQGEFLELMATDVDRLSRLIDKYRRLGTSEPVREPVDLGAMIRALVERQKFVAPAVRTSIEVDAALPDAHVDRTLIETALENLVQNAIEAMPNGGALAIRIERDEHATRGARASVVISVSDTGPGMDARSRDRVFDEFYTTKATGSGLGLPFVRRVAEAHGGDVRIRSAEGRGTAVRLRIEV